MLDSEPWMREVVGGLNLVSALTLTLYLVCDPGQVSSPLWASVTFPVIEGKAESRPLAGPL